MLRCAGVCWVITIITLQWLNANALSLRSCINNNWNLYGSTWLEHLPATEHYQCSFYHLISCSKRTGSIPNNMKLYKCWNHHIIQANTGLLPAPEERLANDSNIWMSVVWMNSGWERRLSRLMTFAQKSNLTSKFRLTSLLDICCIHHRQWNIFDTNCDLLLLV